MDKLGAMLAEQMNQMCESPTVCQRIQRSPQRVLEIGEPSTFELRMSVLAHGAHLKSPCSQPLHQRNPQVETSAANDPNFGG